MTANGICNPTKRSAGFGFLVLSTLAMLFVVHGGGGYQQISTLVYSGTFFLAAIALWFWVKDRQSFSKIQIFFLSSIIAITFISASFGMLHFDTKSGFNFMVINLVVFFFASQVVRRYGNCGTLVLARLFVLMASVASLLAIVLFFYPVEFMGVTFGREDYFRLVGIFSTSNRFGEVPASGSLAALYLFLADRPRKKVWLTICIVFIFVAFLSGSKGVVLGLVSGLSAFVLLTRLMAQKIMWRLSVLLVPLVSYGFYLLYDFFVLAMKLDKILAGRIYVGSGRSEIWAQGVELFWSATLFQQVFGYGATAFVTLTGADAHSMYWSLLVENGLISLVFFGLLFAVAFFLVVARKGDRASLVFGFSLVLFCLVRGVAMPTVFNGFNFAMIAFWAGVALIFVGRRRPCDH